MGFVLFFRPLSSTDSKPSILTLFFCFPCFLQPERKDTGDKEIPLLNVKAPVLNKVVSYMKYHAENPPKEIEKPLKSNHMSEVVEQWDAEFVDVELELLFELI